MHHAYLLVGDFERAFSFIPEEERARQTDFSLLRLQMFGIDEARELQQLASRKPLAYSYGIHVISCTGITLEAQNALLKLFEEPSLSARFYVIVPHGDIVIATLKSRFAVMETAVDGKSISNEATSFLNMSYADRMAYVGKMLEDKNADAREQLLRGLEIWFTETHAVHGGEDILFVRTYARDRSASHKMLLEHLALSLPIVSKIS